MKLKSLRIQKKVSQKEVASYLNVNPVTYCNYEQMKRKPNIDTLKKLSEYFNVSVDYLIDNNLKTDIGFLTQEQVYAVKLLKELNRDNLMQITGRMLEILEQQKRD